MSTGTAWPGRLLALVVVVLALTGAPAVAADEAAGDRALAESELMPLASRSLLLDAARAGDRIVAVGERGHVLVSDDDGASWRQVVAPTRTMLTGVSFVDERRGCAIGHDAVVICSSDGAETWELVHSAPDDNRPLLDLLFLDGQRAIAVGAYGLLMSTDDAGASWSESFFEPSDLTGDSSAALADYHLNALARADDGTLYAAAEAGNLYRSSDDGGSWVTLPTPYEGSYFGVLPLGEGSVLIFGLRGHLFRSDDAGLSWQRIELPTTALLSQGLSLGDATVLLVGLEGTVLSSRDGGRSFAPVERADRRGFWAALSLGGDRLLLLGESGAIVESVAAE